MAAAAQALQDRLQLMTRRMQHGAQVDGPRVGGQEQMQHERRGALVVRQSVGRSHVAAADRLVVVAGESGTAAGPEADRLTREHDRSPSALDDDALGAARLAKRHHA